jgi:4-alpha-glucanotransferase
LFELDERKKPMNVAGVPPDYFSETGQRWGNPLYRWDVHEQTGFDWWKKRIQANAKFYDVIRIDHFIGVVRYYSIPSKYDTAKYGKWKKGPGKKLTDALKEAAPETDFIAEDLGEVVPSVRKLQQQTGWPGMKVLEFGFDEPENGNLPHNYLDLNMVVYGGTHDNEPLLGCFAAKTVKEREFAYRYLNIHQLAELPHAVIRLGYASGARIVMNQMQDILGLDSRSKMNSPGTLGGNWQWRLKEGQFGEEEILWLLELSKIYGRYHGEKKKSGKKTEEDENK